MEKPLHKIRIKYSKVDAMKFLSHLDVRNVFSKAILRANLPISFSGGFNPKMSMTFSFPLPVGTEGLQEYADFEMEKPTDAGIFFQRLQGQLPQGLNLLEAKKIPIIAKALTVIINFAHYEIEIPNFVDCENLNTEVENFMNQQAIVVDHWTKTGIKQIDIKNSIVKFTVFDGSKLRMAVNIGNEKNIRPHEVIEKLFNLPKEKSVLFKVKRTGTYVFTK